MKKFTTRGFVAVGFDSTAVANNKLYDISSSGSYDPETYTITDATFDLTTVFTVGGIVMNACYNDVYANVVSVTANEVVLDGDLRGYYDNAGTIEWYQGYLVAWDDATSAFQITAKSGEGAFIFENYKEFTKSYPGNATWNAPLRSSKLVSYDGDVATLDWPCSVISELDSLICCADGTDVAIEADACYGFGFWMGDGYYMDIGIGGNANTAWFEFHDSYGLSNANQTEEQLYNRYDLIIQRWSDMLNSNYKEDSTPLGENVLGSYPYF